MLVESRFRPGFAVIISSVLFWEGFALDLEYDSGVPVRSDIEFGQGVFGEVEVRVLFRTLVLLHSNHSTPQSSHCAQDIVMLVNWSGPLSSSQGKL